MSDIKHTFLLISPKNRTVWNFRGDLVRDIIARGYDVVVTGPDDTGVEKVLALGARFVMIPLDKNGLSISGDLKYLWKLYRVIRKEKPAATLGYTIKPVIYGAMAARLAGVKNISSMVTGGGYVFITQDLKARLIRFLIGILYRIGFACAHTVIFQNRDDLNELTGKKWVHPRKCRVVNGSGVNMEKFRPSAAETGKEDTGSDLYPGRLTFFMLSRVMVNKGVREYLEACRIIRKKYPEVRCMLLGAIEDIQDSMRQEELQAYIDDGSVEHFGETADVREYYRQCSVYVLPSYREGTPRTVLEAMAMARPVITTDTQGCRETVEDGRNGFLVPVKDASAVAGKMEWFINHPGEIPTMGQESLRLCREKFDVNKVNADMIRHMNLKQKPV